MSVDKFIFFASTPVYTVPRPYQRRSSIVLPYCHTSLYIHKHSTAVSSKVNLAVCVFLSTRNSLHDLSLYLLLDVHFNSLRPSCRVLNYNLLNKTHCILVGQSKGSTILNMGIKVQQTFQSGLS